MSWCLPSGHEFNARWCGLLEGVTLWWEYFIIGVSGLWKQMLDTWEVWVWRLSLASLFVVDTCGVFPRGLKVYELFLLHGFGEAVKTSDSFLTNLTCSWKFSFGLRFMAEELKTKIILVPFVNELFSASPEPGLNLSIQWCGSGTHTDCCLYQQRVDLAGPISGPLLFTAIFLMSQTCSQCLWLHGTLCFDVSDH